jgi:hypothetical protein
MMDSQVAGTARAAAPIPVWVSFCGMMHHQTTPYHQKKDLAPMCACVCGDQTFTDLHKNTYLEGLHCQI